MPPPPPPPDALSSHSKTHRIPWTLLCVFVWVCEWDRQRKRATSQLSPKAVRDHENLEQQNWASFFLEPPLIIIAQDVRQIIPPQWVFASSSDLPATLGVPVCYLWTYIYIYFANNKLQHKCKGLLKSHLCIFVLL